MILKMKFKKITALVLLASVFLSMFYITEVHAATYIQPDTEITVPVPLAKQFIFAPAEDGIYEFEITDMKYKPDFNPNKCSTFVRADDNSSRWECSGTILTQNIKIPFLCYHGKTYNIDFDCDFEYLKFVMRKSSDFHDDSYAKATVVEVGKQVKDYSEHWRDIDWYSFTPTEDGYYRVKSLKSDAHIDPNVNFSDSNDLKCTLFSNGTACLTKSPDPETNQMTDFTKLTKGTTYYFAIDNAVFTKFSGAVDELRAQYNSIYPKNYFYRFQVEKSPEITGNLKFKSDIGTIPATGFKAELMEKSPSGDNLAGAATIDKNGDFDIKVASITDMEKGELYIKVEAGDSHSQVLDPNATNYDESFVKYVSTSKNASDIKDGKLDFGSAELQPGGAFNIVYNIRKAAEFFTSQVPSVGTLPKVDVYWDPTKKSEAGSAFYRSGNSITIGSNPKDPDEYDPSVIDHEYGHFLMANCAHVPPSGGGKHSSSTLCESTGKAYSEGWATFFGQMALNNPQYNDTSSGGTFTGSLEYPRNGYHPKSPYNEIAVAATLWDLADVNNETYSPQYVDNAGTIISDGVNERFSGVANAFLQNNGSTGYADIRGIWDNWIVNYPLKDDIYRAWQVFRNEGLQFDDAPPSIDSVTMPATAISGPQQIKANVSDNVKVAKVFFNGDDGVKASEGVYNYVLDPSKFAKGNNVLLVSSEDQAFNLGRSVVTDVSKKPPTINGSGSGKPIESASNGSDSYDTYSKPYKVQYSDATIGQNKSFKAIGFVVADNAAGLSQKPVATISDVSSAIAAKGYTVQSTDTKTMGTTGKSTAVSFTVREGRDYCLMLHSLDGVFQLEIYRPDGTLYTKVNNPEIPTGVELKGCAAGTWTYKLVSDSVPFVNAVVAYGVGERVGEVAPIAIPARVSNNTLTITGKAYGASQVALSISKDPDVQNLTANVTNDSFTFTNAPLYDGENILTFIPVDAAGKYGDPVSKVVVVDKTTPDMTVQVQTQTPKWSLGDTAPIVAYSDSIKLAVTMTKPCRLWVDSVEVGTDEMNEDRTYALADKTLTAGSNTITVKAQDDAGNIVQKTVTVLRSSKGTYETDKPVILSVGVPSSGIFSNIHNVAVTVADSSRIKVEAFMDNTPLFNSGNNVFTVDISDFYARNYNFVVKVTDVWGNTTIYNRLMLVNSDGTRPTKPVDNDGPVAIGSVKFENISNATQFKGTAINVKDPSGVTGVTFSVRPKNNPAATPFIINGTFVQGTIPGEGNYEAVFDTSVIPFGDVDYTVITSAEDKCGNESILDSRTVSKKMMYREEVFRLYAKDAGWLDPLVGVTHYDTWAYARYAPGGVDWVLVYYDDTKKTYLLSEPIFSNWVDSYTSTPLTEDMGKILSDEQYTPTQKLKIVTFENGAITRIPNQTTTSRLYRPYYRKWMAIGGEYNPLGLPLSNSYYDQPEFARSINFTNGKLCWSPYIEIMKPFNSFIRPQTTLIDSSIYETFRQNPQVGSALGSVVHETLFSYQKCQNGVIVYTNDVLKTFIIPNDFFDKLLEIYTTIGYTLGAPVGNVIDDQNGWKHLECEVAELYWSSGTGFVTVSNQIYYNFDESRDGILHTWKMMAGASGVLGYPLTGVINSSNSTCYCQFEKGTLTYSANTGKTTATGLTVSQNDTIISLQTNQNIINSVPVMGKISTPSTVTKVKVYVDGVYLSDAQWDASTGIFSGEVNANTLTYGNHQITAKAIKSTGTEDAFSTVTVAAVPRVIWFDNQVLAGRTLSTSSTASISSLINYSGCAMDKSGVKSVEVYVDDVYQGNATYGTLRQDIATQYPKYGTANVGFQYSLDTSNYTKENHKIEFVVVPQNSDADKISIKSNFGAALVPPTNTPTPTPTSTSTNTPTNTPTSTSTSTPTNTPTNTPTPTPAISLKVNSMNEDLNQTTNVIKPSIELVNTGVCDVNLSNVKIRYYFTDETGLAPIADLYYSAVGADKTTANFVKTDNATYPGYYLEIGFTSNAGEITPGSKLVFKYGIHNSLWTNYNQGNDTSFMNGQTVLVENQNINVYYGASLIWGNAQTPPPIVPASIKLQYYSEDTSPQTSLMKPALKLVNTGSSTISLADVKIQYHFIDETGKTQVAEVYWADCGNANVLRKVVKSSTTASDTNYYMELGFNQAAGTLAPGASVVIKTGIHSQDYSMYTQGNDYSYNSGFTVFSDQTKITGICQNKLIWGTMPII